MLDPNISRLKIEKSTAPLDSRNPTSKGRLSNLKNINRSQMNLFAALSICFLIVSCKTQQPPGNNDASLLNTDQAAENEHPISKWVDTDSPVLKKANFEKKISADLIKDLTSLNNSLCPRGKKVFLFEDIDFSTEGGKEIKEKWFCTRGTLRPYLRTFDIETIGARGDLNDTPETEIELSPVAKHLRKILNNSHEACFLGLNSTEGFSISFDYNFHTKNHNLLALIVSPCPDTHR